MAKWADGQFQNFHAACRLSSVFSCLVGPLGFCAESWWWQCVYQVSAYGHYVGYIL